MSKIINIAGNHYLNMVWTETMVLQSERVSSSAEFENSLLTTTTLSARVMPALMRSSKLERDRDRVEGAMAGQSFT